MSEIKARAIYDFDRQNDDEISFRAGETLTIVSQHVGAGYEGWWLARRLSGHEGYVPESFVELVCPPEPSMPPPPPPPPQQQRPPSYTPAAVAAPHYQNLPQQAPPPPQTDSFFADESWSSDEDAAAPAGAAVAANNTAAGRHASVSGAPARQSQLAPGGGAPALRKSPSTTLSTASGEAGANRSDPRRATIRGMPKIPGIKDFLLTDDSADVRDVDIICIVNDGQELAWQATSQGFTCKVTDPSKASKMRGLKSYIAYHISTSANSNLVVTRRYKHFDWLHKQLVDKFPCVAVPPLPDKQVTGRYEESFINTRMRQLQCWLNRMSVHPVVGPSLVFQHFLTCTDDGKRWKEGKRRAEQDKLSRGLVYHTVRVPNTCDLADMERFTDAFEGFATEMESSTKLTMDTVLAHSKKCENNIKKEFARIADACFAMEKAACLVPNSKLDSLAQAMKSAGQSYQQVAELWGEQPRRDCDPLAECMHEYSGVISCLPGVVGIGRGAVQTAREFQRGVTEGRMTPAEAQEASRRAALVSAAQCAEMNHFRRGVERDYQAMMAEFLRQQVHFHQEIANKLQSALDAFSY